MAEDLKALRAKRAQLRRFFTLTSKLVEASLNAQPLDLEKVNVEFAKLADKAERLFVMDSRIDELIFANEEIFSLDEEIQKEFEGVEEYRDTWVSISSKRETLLEKTRNVAPPDPSVVSTSSEGLKFKIPKLEIRKFDVQPRTWIAFWAAFKKVDESSGLDTDEKFQVLLQMTKEGTAARRLLDKFPPSEENYQKALTSLKQRFGRDELLIEVYVRDLLGLVIGQAKNVEGSCDIPELVENLETKLMGLESLGVTTDRFACLLLPLVESTLPEPVIREWERSKPLTTATGEETSFTEDATVLMEQLRKFLKKIVISDERVNLVRSGFQAPVPAANSDTVGGKKPSQGQKVATATGLVSLEEVNGTKQKCVFCAQAHLSEYCYEALNMDRDIKVQILKGNKLCFKCLNRFHGMRRCKGTLRCLVCSKGHCTSMCQKKEKEESPPAESNEVAPKEEKNLSNTNCVSVLMQTLQVRVNSTVGPTTARVLIDTGSQRSYITRELAAKMEYRQIREENVVHALFGGSTTDVLNHACYKVRLQSLSGKYACNFDVLDSEKICDTIPAIPKGPWMKELNSKKIPVSDTSDGPIDVLVGSDVAGKLFTGRKEVLSCGLVAMETFLGWTVMGRIRNEESDCMLNVTTLCAIELSPSELWELDAIGIRDPADIATEDPVPITPQMFPSEIPCSGVPDFDAVDACSLKRKLQCRVSLKKDLRRPFRIEYLDQLNLVSGGFNDKRCPKVGEFVLVSSDIQNRLDGPLAIVEELALGNDGKCRAVKLRTAQGPLTGAIQHVFPLEIDSATPVTTVTTMDPSCDVMGLEEDCGHPASLCVDTQGDPFEDAMFDPDSPLASRERDLPVSKKPKRQERFVVKKCGTRCGRKVKLPIKYKD